MTELPAPAQYRGSLARWASPTVAHRRPPAPALGQMALTQNPLRDASPAGSGPGCRRAPTTTRPDRFTYVMGAGTRLTAPPGRSADAGCVLYLARSYFHPRRIRNTSLLDSQVRISVHNPVACKSPVSNPARRTPVICFGPTLGRMSPSTCWSPIRKSSISMCRKRSFGTSRRGPLPAGASVYLMPCLIQRSVYVNPKIPRRRAC